MSAQTQGGGVSFANLSQLHAVGAHALVFSFLCSLLAQLSQLPARISISPLSSLLVAVGVCPVPKHKPLQAAPGFVHRRWVLLGLGGPSLRSGFPSRCTSLTRLLLPPRMKRRGTFPWGAMSASTVSRISWSASPSHRASASTSSAWVSAGLCAQTRAGTGVCSLCCATASPLTSSKAKMPKSLKMGFNCSGLELFGAWCF